MLLVTLCYSYYSLSSDDLLRQAEMADQSLVRQEKLLLDDQFRFFASDLMTFADMQELKAGFKYSSSTAFNDLAEKFKSLLAVKKYYEKIRLIDLKGRELLRVDYRGGRPILISPEALQDKSRRYYFTESATLKQHQIYISPMDLNFEQGEFEQPLEVSIRLITPVVDASEVKQGVLVFNVLADVMFERVVAMHGKQQRHSHLLNKNGDWLFSGNEGEAWSFMFPERRAEQFRDRFHEAWLSIRGQERGQFRDAQGMFTFITIRPLEAARQALPEALEQQAGGDINAGSPLWKLVEYRSGSEMASITGPLASRIASYTLIFLLLLAALLWKLVSHSVNRDVVVRHLRDSEYKYRRLISDLPDGVVVFVDAKMVYANNAALRLFGLEDISAILNRPVLDFVHPESRALVTDRMQAVLDGQPLEAMEEHLLTENGSSLFALITPKLIEFDGKTAIQLVIRDITEQRMTEGALRISRQRHELYMSQTNMAVIEWNTDFTVAQWNHGAETIFGYRAKEAIGRHATELLLFADQRPAIDAVWQQLMANRGGCHSINDNFTRDGRTITCEWHNTPLVRKDGTVIGVTSLCTDISERQRQHDELSKLQMAIDQAGESILITNANAIIEYVNPAFSRITGYAVDEVLGKTPAILESRRQNDSFHKHSWHEIASEKVWEGSMVNKRKDGTLYPVLMSVAPIFDANGSITHFVAIQQDMTAHEKLEENFRQAQKMEALGTLVGGIAHDFNNVLAGMLGSLYLVKKRTASNPDVQDKLKGIEQAGYRAAEMIKQLLAFSRKQEAELKPVPVQPFIREILKLARSSIPENIVILHELGERDYHIRGDGSQMQQMMLNLLVNASHALEGRAEPKITVSLRTFEPDEAFLHVHPGMEGSQLLTIEVADNGCGIKKEHLNRVLEPFFTTKEEGKGSGLGLAMVFGSMGTHGGVVDIESEEDEGTRVKLYFPLSNHAEKSDKYLSEEMICGKSEIILLADDNDQVREIMEELLVEFGYRVLAAADGKQALKLFAEHRQEVGMALLDIVMPVMGGVEVARQLREMQSDLPILFLSGYEKASSPEEYPSLQDIKVLGKPIDPALLSHHLRACMDNAG